MATLGSFGHNNLRHFRYLLIALVLALGGGFIMAGSAGATSSSSSPSAGAVLQVGWDVEPDSLNPFVGIEQSSYELYHLEYDFLTNYSAAHLQTEPGLATSWSHSPDGLTWTFQIRRGAKWQDGVPLTAHDIAFTYNFIMKYRLQAYLSAMQGIKTVTAPNDHTLIITCSVPKADILSMWVPIVPEHIWGRFHSASQVLKFTNSPPVVGSGAFQIVKWAHGQYISCVANKSYWAGAPKVDSLIFRLYTDTTTMASDLRSGAIQLAIDLPAAQVKSLQSDKSLDVQACAQKAFDYLSFNCYTGPSLGNPVLRDPKFRQALQWAINKQLVCQLAYQGYATPGSTIFEPHFYPSELDWDWTPPASEAYTFNLQKASDMLTAAGYRLVNGVRLNKQGRPIVLRLWARTNSDPSQVTGKLITQWFSDLGLKIKFSVQDDSVLSDGAYNTVGRTFEPNYDMYLWMWQPSGSDPGRRLGYFTTAQIQRNNDCAWSDPQYDRLFVEQSQTLDPQKRKQIVWRMEQIFYDQSPYIILDYPKLLEGWNVSQWTGWERIPEPDGAVAFTSDNVDNYRLVHPISANVVSGRGLSTGSIIALAVVIVLAVAVTSAVVVRRRKGRTRGETE